MYAQRRWNGAPGDAAFQQKCFDVFNEMRDNGRTIVFVTHDMGALNRFCHRALLLERGRFKGKWLLGLLIDLPFAISPVVIGLALVLAYGKTGWLGDWLAENGIQVIFSVPGMVLATAIVSLPFVARETIPVLRELGTDAEQAASTLGASGWQAFWRITLPGIRWGVVYGVVLTTARALGEFGAVSIVSGRIEGETQTLPLFVQARFENFDVTGAYTAAVVLALLAFATLILMNLLTRRTRADTVA